MTGNQDSDSRGGQDGRAIPLRMFAIECARCGETFRIRSGGDYGLFVYASPGAAMCYLDSFSDPVFEEVRAVLHEALEGRLLEEYQQAEIFHALLTRSIDPFRDDDPFFPSRDVPCPRCGSQVRAREDAKEPPELETVELPPATHRRWRDLSAAEKRELAVQCIEAYWDRIV